MHVTALVQVRPSVPPAQRRRAIRTLLRAARHARALPGFRRWQTFRTMDASDALLILVDWESRQALRRALDDPALRQLLAEASCLGLQIEGPEALHPEYDRQLVRRDAVVSLLRLGRLPHGDAEAAERDRHLALRALSAAGSIRLVGARSEDGRTSACRIDFETYDGIWEFLRSPLKESWSELADQSGEREAWGINLPALQFSPARKSSRKPAGTGGDAPPDRLGVEMELSEDRRSACLRFFGRVDGSGAAYCEKLCQLLLAEGIVQLEVDVSGLHVVSPEALEMLARYARRLREQGGRFVLVDHEARVRQVTRTRGEPRPRR